ncbi:MAG: transglycosylase SLT domain-containing protein [Candidatus Cloacimonadota bacterium]
MKKSGSKKGKKSLIYPITALLLLVILIYNPVSVRIMTVGVALYYKINPVIFYRLIKTESAFRSLAVSPRHAIGLGQVKQSTAHYLVDDHDPRLLYTPLYNLKTSAKYLLYLKGRFNDNWTLVLAAYNWGETKVAKRIRNVRIDAEEDYRDRFKDVPETYNYIAKVLGPPKKA